MFSNWRGLNIWSYGNWIVSPLMEMCQTCSYTQQTTDSEWRSSTVREREEWKKKIKKLNSLIICLAVERKKNVWWERMTGSFCFATIELHGFIPSVSSNICPMIYCTHFWLWGYLTPVSFVQITGLPGI